MTSLEFEAVMAAAVVQRLATLRRIVAHIPVRVLLVYRHAQMTRRVPVGFDVQPPMASVPIRHSLVRRVAEIASVIPAHAWTASVARVLAAEPAKHVQGARPVKPTGCVHPSSLAEIQTTSVAENLWQAVGGPVSAMVRVLVRFILRRQLVLMRIVAEIRVLR